MYIPKYILAVVLLSLVVVVVLWGVRSGPSAGLDRHGSNVMTVQSGDYDLRGV
ncbi:unnamed protein product, partial [marine sediment metagenome]